MERAKRRKLLDKTMAWFMRLSMAGSAAVLALKMKPPEPAGRGGGSFLRGFLNNRRRA